MEMDTEMDMEQTHPQSPLPPLGPTTLQHHKCLCICENNSEEDRIGYAVDSSLKVLYSIKSQQTCAIINLCVFVNTTDEEMDTEMDTEPNSEPELTHLGPSRLYHHESQCICEHNTKGDGYRDGY